MEGEIFYVAIFKKINTLNFTLDAHYTSTKVKKVFQLSIYCNAQFFEKSALISQNLPLQ